MKRIGVFWLTSIFILVGLSLLADSPSAVFVGRDDSSGGTWIGNRGTQGYCVIADETNSLASAATSVSGNGYWIWPWPSGRGLQRATNPSDDVYACWMSPDWQIDGFFNINVNIGDSFSHRTSFYCLDWDGGRLQRIDVFAHDSGDLLDSVTLNDFQSGSYLTWDVKGNVDFKFVCLSGANSVVSGIFIDPVPTLEFVTFDTISVGDWMNKYGGEGYNIITDETNYPAYAEVSISDNRSWIWPWPRGSGLQQPEDPSNRVYACWMSADWQIGGFFTIDIAFKDSKTHQFAVYCLDWDGGRSQRIEILDGITGLVLDTRQLDGFTDGKYLVFTLQGHVKVRFTCLAGANAVVSGLFFDDVDSDHDGLTYKEELMFDGV